MRKFDFQINRDGQQIGLIRKEYSGVAKEAMTDSDNFYVTFPREIDVGSKLTLIGAVLLMVCILVLVVRSL